MAMKFVPPLDRMRTIVSEDGRVVRFFLMFKGGQHSAFAIHFNKVGLFLRAINNTMGTMSARLSRDPEAASVEIIDGLAEALVVTAVAAGRNEAGEKLLWIETNDSGAFSFRLTDEARVMLADAVQEDVGECENAA